MALAAIKGPYHSVKTSQHLGFTAVEGAAPPILKLPAEVISGVRPGGTGPNWLGLALNPGCSSWDQRHLRQRGVGLRRLLACLILAFNITLHFLLSGEEQGCVRLDASHKKLLHNTHACMLGYTSNNCHASTRSVSLS